MHSQHYRLRWPGRDSLVAYEPTLAQIAHHAPELSAAYSEPHNSAMMSNSGPMSPVDVVEYYERALREGARPLFLEQEAVLVGDADLRHFAGGRAEATILIAGRAAQGKGLGTRFGIMLHAFAFRALGLEWVHVAIIPENLPSQRLFAKLGHAVDDSAEGRFFADSPSDVTLSVSRAGFEVRFRPELDTIQLGCERFG